MAREHARILLSIWDDPDFLALRHVDQWTYFAMLSHRDLSWCGVAPLLPQRYATLAADLTATKVRAALDRLTRARFVVMDDNTAEIAARTFVRHDGIMKQPNVIIAALKAWDKVHSEAIREAIRQEFARAYAEGFPEGFPEGFHKSFGRAFPDGFGDLFANSPSPFPLPHLSQVQVANARAALTAAQNVEPGEGWVGDVLGLEASR